MRMRCFAPSVRPIRALVGAAALRQANCYASSSDAAVADRYEAVARYEDVKQGAIRLEGGWRVYSSGAGVALRLIHQCFLGLRRGRSVLTVDPVIPKSLDGLRVETELDGVAVTVEYRVAQKGHGPMTLTLNGTAVPFEREENPYRTGAAAVPMAALRPLLTGSNTLVVALE
jgi:1,2-beta-oligoglucan phosphorylase